MNYIIFVPIFLLLFLTLYEQSQQKKQVLQKIILKQNGKEKIKMVELAKRFLGKDCLIYTFNSQLNGTIKEVTDGAVLIENKTGTEIVNIDYIVRIREYPVGKNGKKKSIITD